MSKLLAGLFFDEWRSPLTTTKRLIGSAKINVNGVRPSLFCLT